MYFTLYDRNLSSIGETYILESWSRTQRSIDFDDMRLIGEKIPYSAEPFCVVANDKQGTMLFSGLASTPIIDETAQKTFIMLKDYTTLWNTDIIMDWSSLSYDLTVANYLNRVLEQWLEQTDVGFVGITWNTDFLSGLMWDKELPLGSGKESISVYTLIKEIFLYYNVYCVPELHIQTKTLKFIFKYRQSNRTRSIRLEDFGVPKIEKSFGEFNRANVYDHEYTLYQSWGLTEDNSVVKFPTDKSLIYPAKCKNFVSKYIPPKEPITDQEELDRDNAQRIQALNSEVYEAVMELANNRYQEDITLDVQQSTSVVDLTSIDFSYYIDVYTSDGFYKSLPVGEIQTNSDDKFIIRLGYQVQELTQEL